MVQKVIEIASYKENRGAGASSDVVSAVKMLVNSVPEKDINIKGTCLYLDLKIEWLKFRSSDYLNKLAMSMYMIYLYDMWSEDEDEGLMLFYRGLALIEKVLLSRGSLLSCKDVLPENLYKKVKRFRKSLWEVSCE